ncbi:MAG: hypothetical protein KJ600_05290 [Nanoarchaeota archaeon]|nr:hypothetical protein [Nanoarchaeota archaeon]
MVEIGIPLAVAFGIYFIQQIDKDYTHYIIYIIVGVCIIVGLLYFIFRFLDKREERWVDNRKLHNQHITEIKDLKIRIKNQEDSINLLKQDMAMNNKINKLENRISYIEGKKDGNRHK